MKHRNRHLSALALSLCSSLVVYSCIGTETENPVADLPDVVDTTSPEHFTEPEIAPGCDPPDRDEEPNLPVRPSNAVSDADGRRWTVTTDPPEVQADAVPTLAALDSRQRLIQLDVSDAAEPVRVAQADLEGELWDLRVRGDQVWATTARRVPEQRGCAATQERPYACVSPAYEALQLRGFRPNGAALEPIGQAELPFEQRAWLGSDGIASLADGALHVLAWDGSGALRPPLSVNVAGPGTAVGPADVTSNRLSVVSVLAGATSLHIYDLDADPASARSFELGARASSPGSDSLFANQRLWLQSEYGSTRTACSTCVEDPAQVWALADGAAVRIELPAPYHTVLPVDGALRAGETDEVLAVGWLGHNDGISATLLSFRGNEVAVLGAAPALDQLMRTSFGQGREAPAGVRGAGEANAWQIFVRGMGLPLGIEAAPPVTDERFLLATAGVRVAGALEADASFIEAALEEAYVPGQNAGGVQPSPELVVTGGATPVRLELAPGADELIPTAAGVVAVATRDITSCQQSGRDCSGYAPGVAVFDLSGEPRLTGALPFPELPLPTGLEENRISVSWRSYDALTQDEQTAFPLDATRLAFVAQADLNCDTTEDCQALGLDAVPIAQAGVIVGVAETCPPSDVETECVPVAAPVVYGRGRRQYFYVLELDAAGAPSWQPWGTSTLESSATRIDHDARFATPLATDGVLAATRLERRSSSGDPLPPGDARFMLDRFVLQPNGQPTPLPPVNVPGYPLARLGASAGVERWISAEALPGGTGHPRLQRLNIREDGARIERQLELDGGRFVGLRVLDLESEQRLGVALLSPENGCGTTRLSSIRLGSSNGDGSEPLELADTIELPADRWTLAAIDHDHALLRHGQVYVLVQVDPSGALSLAGTRSSDVDLINPQLLGQHLFGAAGRFGSRRLDFTPAP